MSAPDGRTVVRWRADLPRGAAIDKFCDGIAAAAPELCDRGGSIAQRDGKGGLGPCNLATFRALLDRRICGARVVCRDGLWLHEFFTYQFAPTPRAPHWDGRGPTPAEIKVTEPDEAALREIYLTALVHRLDPVVE